MTDKLHELGRPMAAYAPRVAPTRVWRQVLWQWHKVTVRICAGEPPLGWQWLARNCTDSGFVTLDGCRGAIDGEPCRVCQQALETPPPPGSPKEQSK